MKRIFCFTVVLAIVFYACSSNSSKQPAASDAYAAPDEAAIKKAVDDAYASLSFEKGQQLAFDSIQYYFIPQAQLINYIADTAQVLSISDFVKAYKNYVETAKPVSFREEEVYGRTDQYGKIAQRISTYRTYINSNDLVTERGVNSFQLIKTPQGWKVSSIIWDVEKTGSPIPKAYLGK